MTTTPAFAMKPYIRAVSVAVATISLLCFVAAGVLRYTAAPPDGELASVELESVPPTTVISGVDHAVLQRIKAESLKRLEAAGHSGLEGYTVGGIKVENVPIPAELATGVVDELGAIVPEGDGGLGMKFADIIAAAEVWGELHRDAEGAQGGASVYFVAEDETGETSGAPVPTFRDALDGMSRTVNILLTNQNRIQVQLNELVRVVNDIKDGLIQKSDIYEVVLIMLGVLIPAFSIFGGLVAWATLRLSRRTSPTTP